MKSKVLLVMTVVIMAVMFAGCYNDGRGTYYPDSTEMVKNLRDKGYEVTVEEVEEGRHLDAQKGDEFIEFYWMKDETYCDKLTDDLKERHEKIDKLSSTTKSPDFGNIIFCSTKKAMDASGIQIIEVNTGA
ncbi:MAG: hypothetical protein IIZ09_10325 [Ruminococcus sp.]|nr:hypothetical protein [Ruminococcus sp.]